MDTGTLFVWATLTSAVGAGYFVYGKKQARFVALICGILLCIFPYFVSVAWLSYTIGGVLLVLPFVVRA